MHASAQKFLNLNFHLPIMNRKIRLADDLYWFMLDGIKILCFL